MERMKESEKQRKQEKKEGQEKGNKTEKETTKKQKIKRTKESKILQLAFMLGDANLNLQTVSGRSVPICDNRNKHTAHSELPCGASY